MARQVVIPYAPRKVFVPFHQRTERWAALVAHRRCGKTVACVNDLVARALRLKLQHGRFAYVAPFLAQAKEVAWEYLKRYARPATKNVNESELWVELVNGARIRIHGADNADRLRGAYLDGVILDEYADMRPSVWGEVIRPMLADRQGWATFIGTPKGRNEFFEIYQRACKEADWHSAMLRASETGILPADELEDARATMTPEAYEQEFECSFEAAILGAYYGSDVAAAERDGRIGDHDYDPALPVHCAWDLGIGDSTALWLWQAAPGGPRIIECFEDHGKALPHYVAVLNSKPYQYGIDFLPHDAQARELQTGKTRVEALLALGRKDLRVVSQQTVEDGINAVRMMLPHAYFHSRCGEGIEALRQYRREFDEKTKAFKNKPKHDWTSHYADALRYLALAWREMVPVVKKVKPTTDLIFTANEHGNLVANMTVYDRVMQLARKRRVQEHGY